MDINIDDLTLGDLEEVEKIAGVSVGELFADGKLPAKALKAIVWVMRRREDPTFSLEDAANVKVSDFSDTEDPTDAAS